MRASPPRQIVAVVDDDSRILESLSSLLEAVGHEVRLYSSASAFLVDDRLPLAHCLITDVGMPLVDGFKLRCLVRQRWPALPVILISGRIQLEEVREAGHTYQSFFPKPFESAELLKAVSAALSEGGSARNQD